MRFKSKLDNKQNMVGKLAKNSHGYETAVDLRSKKWYKTSSILITN